MIQLRHGRQPALQFGKTMRTHESPAVPAPADEPAAAAQALRAAPPAPRMYVAGTPHAHCTPLAQAVWQHLTAANPELQGGVHMDDDDGGMPLQTLAAAEPDARFIVLADSPTRALAHWIGGAGSGTPEQALARWCEGVRRLLDHAHRRPDHCLLVDAAEAAAAPEALALALNRWNATLADPAQPAWAAARPAPTIDPLCMVLAQQLVPADSAAQRLFEELHASCVPLTEEELPAGTDAAAALQSYRVLSVEHGAAAEAESLAAAHERLAQAAESGAAALKAELAESRQESELLLLQLHQVQEELEAVFAQQQQSEQRWQGQAAAHAELEQQHRATVDSLSQKLRDTQAALQQFQDAAVQAQAETRQAQAATRQAQHMAASQLAGLQAEMNDLRHNLQRQSADLGQARADAETASGQLQPLREALARESQARRHAEAAAAGLRSELDASRQEGELLLLQLHQVQEELEQHFLQHKELETAARTTTVSAAGQAVRAGGIRLVQAAEELPHRHLHFELQQVQLGARSLQVVETRLAEHHGRPGLVLFDSGAEARPLSAWRSTGQEGGRDYLLLVPADAPSMALLQQLGSSDWQWVQGLARLLQQHLADNGDSLPAHWRTVAARLCRQLDDLPARFRYDSLSVLSDPQQAGALRVAFGGVQYGDRALGTVELRWQTAGQGLHWLAPEQAGAVPLALWPVDTEGHLQPSWQVPVGTAFETAGKRQAWAAMPAADRALLLALLDALPGAAAHAPDTALPAGMTHGLLAGAAAGLHKDARRTLNSLRVRNVARRLLTPVHRNA